MTRTRSIRTRLAMLFVGLAIALPLGMHAARASNIAPADAPGHGRHWACVGEIDVNIGVCLDNPIPPPPF